MIKLNKIGTDRAINFATEEFAKYIRLMNSSEDVQILNNDILKDELLNVGICDEFDKLLPEVADKELDDAIYIDVTAGKGIITGTNPRSVLIAVYRFLREVGVKFIRPGTDNEIIPDCDITTKTVKICEKASLRHREVCIEGSCSYQHVSDLIDWLPKISMNGYYIQFMKPYGFFNLWYNHTDNPYREPEPKTDDELAEIHEKIVDEMAERGLLHFAVGHCWNTEPIGISTTYWDKAPEPPSPEIRPLLAEVNGKRDWFGGVPLNTNLCYSNPKVKELMADAVVNYAKKNPTVKYIVVWLADGHNNTCECEECKKSTNIDLYLALLNHIDNKLTELNMDTKIVFSSRARRPVKERINKNDRITIMFCPICRDFSATFPVEIGDDYNLNLPDFGDNIQDIEQVFKPIEMNVAQIKMWKDMYDGDSVIYDYQLMWFHQKDPGYMMVSENLNTDMKALKTLGINGMNSCQNQRVFFRTALPMVSMAETLWNTGAKFEDIVNEYFPAAYGKDGLKLAELLNIISQRDLIRMSAGADSADWAKYAGEKTKSLIYPIYDAIEELKVLVDKNANDDTLPEPIKRSWYYLTFYPRYAQYWADLWMASYGENDPKKAYKLTWECVDYLLKHSVELDRVMDDYRMPRIVRVVFETRKGATTADAELND